MKINYKISDEELDLMDQQLEQEREQFIVRKRIKKGSKQTNNEYHQKSNKKNKPIRLVDKELED